MQKSSQSLPKPFSQTCFTAHGVFSPEECQQLVGRMDPVKIDTRIDKELTSGASEEIVRIVERTSLRDEELAQWLWSHLWSILPRFWRVAEDDEHMGPFAKGEWELDRIDHRIQLYRYEPGGIFTKHRDGPTYHSVDLRSFFTVLVYLNEGYQGGHTTVFTDDLTQRCKVEGGEGNCFIMLQRTLHEGSKVEEGVKCALRCDVLYKRSLTSDSAEHTIKHLDRSQQAREWFNLASALELSGCVSASVPYYQRASKLDPSVLF